MNGRDSQLPDRKYSVADTLKFALLRAKMLIAIPNRHICVNQLVNREYLTVRCKMQSLYTLPEKHIVLCWTAPAGSICVINEQNDKRNDAVVNPKLSNIDWLTVAVKSLLTATTLLQQKLACGCCVQCKWP